MAPEQPTPHRVNSFDPESRTKKRFIICCDGTWNSSDSGEESVPSNVALLSRMIGRRGTIGGDKDKPIEQVVYYQTGVGTGPTTGLTGKAANLVQGMTGSGLEEHVLQAYNFIATNYEAGDEVLLFGFSRGAYTARAVGGLLTQMGLLNPVDLKYFNSIYRCFKEQGDKINYTRCTEEMVIDPDQVRAEKVLADALADDEKNNRAQKSTKSTDASDSKPAIPPHVHHDEFDNIPSKVAEFPKWTVCVGPQKQGGGIWSTLTGWAGSGEKTSEKITLTFKPAKIELEVIGVWDTVGALGMPDSVVSRTLGVNKGRYFHSTALNKRVKRAYQALALDEHRGAFSPTLWYLKDDPEKKNTPEDLSLKVDLRQCWFPGYHSDIGGGSTMDDSFVADKGAHNIDQISLAWMCDQVEGLVTFHKDVAYAFLPGASIENWTAKMSADPMKSYYWLNIGGGSIARAPGTYNRADLLTTYNKKGEVVPLKENEDIDQHTRERIHPSVKMLIDATKQNSRPYNPAAFAETWNLYGKGNTLLGPKWEHGTNPNRDIGGSGFCWRRPELLPTKATFFSSEVHGNREIRLEEHVIIDRGEGYHNFEARLLTDRAKQDLERSNAKAIPKIVASLDKQEQLAAEGSEVFGAPGCHDDWWIKKTSHQKAHCHGEKH